MPGAPDHLGSFQVLATLGSGNFGTVYLAQGEVKRKGGRPGKRKRVAIKQLHNPGDRSAFDQLRSEFELLEQVHHRSLCKVYDFLESDAAVVMEVVEGRTLREVLEVLEEHRERIPTEAAIEIGCEVADCLSQCWGTIGANGQQLQLVHRDLKPENIMITPKGEVKILDFGLARAQAKLGRGRDRTVKGTPLYMAPEQALGRGTDHRTDLFALGLILYELLMGRPAYEIPESGDDPVAAIMRRIEAADLQQESARIQEQLPGPGPVVARCLQPSPRARYDTGHELMLDLRRQLTRDRGAYLADFCDYFFHNLDRDDVDGLPPPEFSERGGTPPGRERSDTRREAMANDKRSGPPRPGGRPPRPGGRPSGPARPGGGPARRGPPSRPGPSAPSGPPGPRKVAPPKPPGPPSPRVPSPSSKGPPSLKPPGMGNAKTGKETGMLQMVPLQKTDDDDVGGAPKSATQFFSIPKSKKAAKKPSPSSAGAAIGGPKPAGRSMPGAGSVGGSAIGGAPPMARGGSLGSISGPTAGIGGPIAAGPTSSMGSTGGSNSPFQVGGSPDTGGQPEQRARSFRIYAIILGLFFFAFLSMVAAVVAVVVGSKMSDEEGTEEVVKDDRSSKKKEDKSEKKGGEDTAAGIEEVAPAPPPKPTRRASSGGSSAPAAPSAPRAPAGPGSGVVKITLSGASALNVEIKCPSGFRKRGAFQGGTATISGVPSGQQCTAMLKGGAPLQANGIVANRSYTCSPAGSTMSCK